ncbi:MAG: hypothetical protein ACU843_15340 [Gammaproteobacteria bacterium]
MNFFNRAIIDTFGFSLEKGEKRLRALPSRLAALRALGPLLP